MALDAETLAQFVETVTRFVDEKLVPIEAQVAEEDRIPDTVLAEMRALGLYGLSIPQEYGGLALSMTEEAEVIMALTRTSPAFRSAIGTNVGIGSQGLVMDGTQAQKERYLPRLASGELVSSFALTEPDAGSDAASLKTSARLDGGHYVLNGTKRYITNAPFAGIFTVMARTDPARKGGSGISAFLVEAGTPGLRIGRPEKKMGQQGAQIADVIFEDCRVPASALLGGVEGKGFGTAMKVLDKGRIHIAAVCVGVAERIIKDTVRYAVERQQFGHPIAQFQLIQGLLADCKTECYAARSMVMDAAARRDAGQILTFEASAAKYFASEMVGRVADKAVQIFGGAGYIADYGIERFYRDVRLFRIYEGTSQVQQVIIARHMLREAGGEA